jgi:hypothetical protein
MVVIHPDRLSSQDLPNCGKSTAAGVFSEATNSITDIGI